MKLVLEITSHSGDGVITHRAVESFPAYLGRGYHNDIILSDPHVSADHISIDFNGETWIVRDLGSANGLFLNGTPAKQASVILQSGDRLRVGRTEIRAFRTDHPIESAVLLQKANPVFLWITRPINVFLSFALAMAAMTGVTWLEVWSKETSMTVSVSGATAFGIILVWVAVWAAAGRLIRHKPHFLGHTALISLYMAASCALWYFQSYIDFLSNENIAATVFNYAVSFSMLGLLVYGALSLATDMSKRKRTLSAIWFSLGLLASVLGLSYASAQDFKPEPEYPVTLEPWLSGLAPAQDLDGFMAQADKVFSSSEFKEKHEKKKDD